MSGPGSQDDIYDRCADLLHTVQLSQCSEDELQPVVVALESIERGSVTDPHTRLGNLVSVVRRGDLTDAEAAAIVVVLERVARRLGVEIIPTPPLLELVRS